MKTIMKESFITLFILAVGMQAFASDREEALDFFNNFVSASNNYSSSLLNMYSNHAKIIRQVVKPNGELVNAYFNGADYKKQMVISSKIAKLRHYKNHYSNINAERVANGYKITALRQPTGSSYKLKTATVVTKQPNGKWVITEELMQTKEQIFLKYAK